MTSNAFSITLRLASQASQSSRVVLLANDGAGLGVTDKHAGDKVVGLRLHAGLALQVLVYPHMHLIERILQSLQFKDQCMALKSCRTQPAGRHPAELTIIHMTWS